MLYKTVIIGLGQIGMGYDLQLDREKYIYSHARAFNEHANFQLIGGIDSDFHLCAIFESAFKAKTAYNVNDASFLIEADVVVIASPTTTHLQIVQSILEKTNPKAILCEKPIAYSVADGLQIVDLCAENRVDLYVNYMRRSEQASVEIKHRIGNDQILGLLKGFVWYSKGLIHNGSHFFNLLEYWLGKMHNFQIISRGRFLSNGKTDF